MADVACQDACHTKDAKATSSLSSFNSDSTNDNNIIENLGLWLDFLPSSRPPFPSWHEAIASDLTGWTCLSYTSTTNLSFSFSTWVTNNRWDCHPFFSPRLHSRMNKRRRSGPSSSKYSVRAVDTDILDKIIQGLIKVPVSKLTMEHNRRQSSPQ